MHIKDYIIIAFVLLSIDVVMAQSADIHRYMEQAERSFNDYEARQQQSFEQYRRRLNAEFAEYMRQVWQEYEAKPAEPIPDRPKPPAPVIKDSDTSASNDPVPFDVVTPAPKPIVPPQPVAPLRKPKPQPAEPDKPVQPQTPQFTFAFYGTTCAVSLTDAHRFRLSAIDENSVADGWMLLSSDRYNPVIAECLEWRDKLHLPD